MAEDQKEEEIALLASPVEVDVLPDDARDQIDNPSGKKHWRLDRRKLSFRWSIIAYIFGPLLLAAMLCVAYLVGRYGGVQEMESEQVPQSGRVSFSGAFKRFPDRPSLPKKQQRLTLIAVWDSHVYKEYLRHFLHGIQLNADAVDLVFVNRKLNKTDTCVDFESHGVNVTWGGNINLVCMENEDWVTRRVDFLCNTDTGWNCSESQREMVYKEMDRRRDLLNLNWKVLHGYFYKDLFLQPENPFWAWIDVDSFVGRFDDYPFTVLSQVSFVSSMYGSSYALFLPGQLTAFNLEDKALASAWRKAPEAHSPETFIKSMDYNTNEEIYWGIQYMRSEPEFPGSEFSWVMLPDMQGDDGYDRPDQHYLISGRDVLLVDGHLSRQALEGLLRLERRQQIPDERSFLDWTGGLDGSEFMLNDPNMTSSEALAMSRMKNGSWRRVFKGVLETVKIRYKEDCPGIAFIAEEWRQCVPENPLTTQNPSLLRANLIRFREQASGYLFRRLERDRRAVTHSRKIMRHHLVIKHTDWFEFPPFEITDDKIFLYNWDGAVAFEMGANRDKNIFERRPPPPPPQLSSSQQKSG